MQFSFEFIHLQICTRYNLFVHRKKSYQLLICRVAKHLPVLELLNNFIKSSTVAYKRVAYKKNLAYNLIEGAGLRWPFPNCFGVAEKMHIRNIHLKINGSKYYNYRRLN